MFDIEMMRYFLMWCSIVNISMYALSILITTLFLEHITQIAVKWYKIPETEIKVRILSQIGRYKTSIIVLNLVPYLVLEFAF